MIDTLKPCPFCGRSGRLIESHRYDPSVDKTPPHWKVSCENIGCNGAAINIWRGSEEAAIEAWNTRHEPEELPEWAIRAINTRIKDLELAISQAQTKQDINLLVGERFGNNWVLTLRKPEAELKE